MSSRVESENQARRLEQERQQKTKDKAQSRDAREKFARAMTDKKAETGDSSKQERIAQSRTAQRQGGQSALMARAGIQQAGKFQALLQNAGQQNIKQGESQGKIRDGAMRRDNVDEKETNSRVSDDGERLQESQREAERVEAVEGDRGGRGGGGGMGGGFGGGESGQQSGQGDALGSVAAAGPAADLKAPEQVRGANPVPQLPAAVMAELVKRVMVGVDEGGMGNFVIQLKDDVLGGATVQISAKDGKISARFTLQDENVGRLIKASEGPLARAFANKGMTLERLDVETP